jgi:hypothetical protein
MNSAETQHFAAIRLAQPARTRSGEMVSHTVARHHRGETTVMLVDPKRKFIAAEGVN